MLYTVNGLFGYALEARDGRLGKVKDLYFDDHVWRVRYLVVETGGWLNRKSVLLSPAVLDPPLIDERCFPVKLTQQQVRDSPDIQTDLPVSRQMEESMLNYYGWSNYWLTDFEPGLGLPVAAGSAAALASPDRPHADPNLRSVRDVTGYKIQALDSEEDEGIGEIADWVVDGDDWTVRYAQIKDNEGREFLLNPWWARDIDWASKTVYFDLTAAQIRSSPPFTTGPLDRDYEERLHTHYGRRYYWDK